MKILTCLFIILGFAASSFSSYGHYKISRVEAKKNIKITPLGDSEKWIETTAYNKRGTPILRLLSKTELHDRIVSLTFTIKNMTNATIRFYLVFETNYLIIKPIKIVLFAKQSLTKKNIAFYTSGHYEHIDWGFAFYKSFTNRNIYNGKGIIEHW